MKTFIFSPASVQRYCQLCVYRRCNKCTLPNQLVMLSPIMCSMMLGGNAAYVQFKPYRHITGLTICHCAI